MTKPALNAVAVSLTLFLLPMSPVTAGVEFDALARCMEDATTARDENDLVRWLFATAALHPVVSSISVVSPEQRTAMARTVGRLFERLLTESCRPQFAAALERDGQGTVENAFQVLGQEAMRALMADPNVAEGFDAVETFIRKDKLELDAKPAVP
ncbi:MAG: hypothetical protein KBF21_14340 [Thermoanaerobaculia bacterium]|nr:hypothetical protein [Thermoanaerobaculia bacterium]MBP9825400.1 hypothetical protein [Thermoanaerobaculia bacterium]